ncbi:MAG: hypothetical protein WBE43_03045 [Candidatus Acidiferrales bacterium]
MEVALDVFEAESLADEMVKTQEKSGDWKWFLATFVSFLAVSAIFYGFIHSDLSKLTEKVDGIDKRVVQLDAAVHIIADKEGGDTKGLIDDILSAAKLQQDSGNPAVAARILNRLQGAVADLKQGASPLPSQSLAETAHKLEKFRALPDHSVSQAALNGIVALANYQSSTTPVPASFQSIPVVTRIAIGDMELKNGRLYLSNSFLSGNAIDNSGGHGFDIDNTVLKNVVLDRVKIVYRGGPVTLENVHFVNCEFQVLNRPTSDELLQAVIQNNKSVNIG